MQWLNSVKWESAENAKKLERLRKMDTIETNANSYIFQVDNDLVHCASIVQEYIQTNTIPGMLSPAQSPRCK